MKKEDIINKVMDEFDIARIDASEIVNNIFSGLRNSLIKGKHINISEFGKFDVNYKKGDNGKILKTIAFSPVKKFSYDVNDSYNNLEPVTVAFITNFKEEDNALDIDMEDYEEIIDEIDEKEFIKSRVTVVEEKKDDQAKFKEEIKERFKESFKETFKEEPGKTEEKPGKETHKISDARKKSFFESERYRLSTTLNKELSKPDDLPEVSGSDEIISEIIEPVETIDTVDQAETADTDKFETSIETPKEITPDLTFVDREEPEEPLVVEFNKNEFIEDAVEEKEEQHAEHTEQSEIHGYIPSEKEILDFERIREELNNKIKETFTDFTSYEPSPENEIIEEEIQEEEHPEAIEDIEQIESKEPETRTPEESNILEEDLITQQEDVEEIEDKTEYKIEEPESEEPSKTLDDMFEEKEDAKKNILDPRDEIINEIEDKVSKDFADLDENDFSDIDSDTIKKIEDVNKATEERLKKQTPDDDIKIPDFDFKNLFKESISGSKTPEQEINEEFIEKYNEEVNDISGLEQKNEDLSFEGSDILIPEEIKQLHEEIQTANPEGVESNLTGTQFKHGEDKDSNFDFFKDYNDIFEDKDNAGTGNEALHPSNTSKMAFPKHDVTDEQKEGSKIFSLSIMILIGIVIAVFAGIYFLLSSDLFKPKPSPVLMDSVKTEQQVAPVLTDSLKNQNLLGDTAKGRDTVSTTQQTQKPETTKTVQTPPPVQSNNQTASNPEESQYRKLNPGEEEQINDAANNVVYIRTTDGVFIQTGSYKDKSVAESKAEALRKAGVQNVSIVEANLGAKGIYYRVRVGKYLTVQEAKNNSQKVKI